MADGDTLRLLTRYHVGAWSDPRENRLTAAVVALLDQDRHLAQALAQDWLPGASRADDPVTATIQRAVGGNVGWVDFELEVGRPVTAVIWVEVKLGSKLSGDNQLAKYRERLAAMHPKAERLVLLLAPNQQRGRFAHVRPLVDRRGRDDGPFLVAWQEVYRLLGIAAKRKGGRPHARWLLREVLGYMATEGLKV